MSPVTIELRKGRKRRPSNSLEDVDDPVMDDCMAAMVLMSLSCSPKSTFIPDRGIYSVSVKSIDSGVDYGSAASRSNTPSPPTINEEPSTASPITIEINNNSNHVETIKANINTDCNVNNQINGLTIIHKDEGIDMDETIDFIIDDPIQTIAEKARRIVFKCTWRGCGLRCDLVESIERHIRTVHLGRGENASEEENDHEEEFYYAEIEEEMEIDDNISSKDSLSSNDSSSLGPLSPVSSSPESPHSTNYNLSPTLSSASLLFFAPSPTWSHLDMARPPHEDPEYQMQQKQIQLQQLQQQQQHQHQQQIQIQNQQVQNFNQQQQTSSVTQTFISAQFKPEPERKTVISSPINIPGISVAHRWSTKVIDSSSASSSNTSCNSSYSFSNSHHHHHHHHLNQHLHNNNHHHNHKSQASFITTSSSPVNFFSPKAPSKVMRLSSNTSSPINIKSSGCNTNTNTNNNNTTLTLSGSVTVNGKTNSNNVTSIISSTNNNNPTMSTNTTTNANNASSNQWTSLLQSSSTSFSASSSSSSTSLSSPSSTNTATATTLLKGSSISPTRRTRTETRKCRKVYGMDNRDSWCTQCKWKKACTRFVD